MMENITDSEVTPAKFYKESDCSSETKVRCASLETRISSELLPRRSLRLQFPVSMNTSSPVPKEFQSKIASSTSDALASESCNSVGENLIETTPVNKKLLHLKGFHAPLSNKKLDGSRPPSLELSLVTKSPSPYKPRRPKGLPKAVKQLKKKGVLRNQVLEDFKLLDEKLQHIVSSQAFSIKSVKNQVTPDCEDNDTLGTLMPSTVIFSPSEYSVLFDENSLQPSDFVSDDSVFFCLNTSESIRRLKTYPIFSLSAKECRFCSYLLSITTDCSLVNLISPIIFRKISDNSFYLGWSDVKQLLINFGLGFEYNKLNGPTATTKPPVKKWNFDFFFSLLKYSYPHYRTNCVKKLLFFLIDCLFEPLLFDLHASLIHFVQKITLNLIQNGVSISTLLTLVDRYYLSLIHNRYIFQCLALDASLTLIAKALGESSVYQLLEIEYSPYEERSLSNVLDVIEENAKKFESVRIKSVYQVFLICEKLALFCFAPTEKREMFEKLILLAEKININYSHYEHLYFSETINRLKEQTVRFRS